MKLRSKPLLLLFLGLLVVSSGGAAFYGSGSWSEWGPPRVVGQIELAEIKESSGLSASECQDVLWTHNDAGNEPLIYGMDLTGKHVGTWRVPNATNVDWESIATYREPSGKCSLLIADIGDNDVARGDTVVYRIPEPAISPAASKSNGKNPLQSAPAEPLKFKYPDGPKNAETILVHPRTGLIYIVTKMKTGPAQVHTLQPRFGSAEVAVTQKVAEVSLPSNPIGLVTGGSISPDGSRVMLCDVKGGYEFVLKDTATDPDRIWKQTPTVVNLGERKQGEGVSYGRDGYTLYASSEKKNTALIKIERKRS